MFKQKFAFSLVVFCWQAAISLWFLLFFIDFLDFFLNGFPNPIIVLYRSSFLFSQWKFFELYVRLVLLCFLCRRHDFCNEHMTSQPLQICFLFIRSCNFNLSACVTSFFALSGASFFFNRMINFLVSLDLLHSEKGLPHFEIDFLFTFFQRDKVKSLCVTLNEGYLRASNRGSRNVYRFFDRNITYQPSIKRRTFLSFFITFLRLQIYKAIAAIFLQSASYVFNFFELFFFRNGFPNWLIVRFRSKFLFSQGNFFELYVKTFPAMFFFISSSRFMLRPYDVAITSNLFFCWIVYAI